MSISDNKTITDFLQEQGHQPTSVKGNNWWYLSPLRNEHTASFKVDVNKNVWYDFGLGKGGNLRTLVKLLLHDTNYELPSNHFFETGHPNTRQLEKSNVSFSDITIMELKNHSLLSYLKKRGINEAIAVQYCKEIHYTNCGKRYYSVGFVNRNGGYEIRNAYFKVSITLEVASLFPKMKSMGLPYLYVSPRNNLSASSARLERCQSVRTFVKVRFMR